MAARGQRPLDVDDLQVGRSYIVAPAPGVRAGWHGAIIGELAQLSQTPAGTWFIRLEQPVRTTGGAPPWIMFDTGRVRIYEDLSHALGKKAKDQAVRDMYDKATRDPSRKDEYGKPMAQSGAPGHGPADMIRKAMGVQPPRGAMGGRTRRRRRHRTRRHR